MIKEKKKLFIDTIGTLMLMNLQHQLASFYAGNFFRTMNPAMNLVNAVSIISKANPDIELYIVSPVLADHSTMEKEINLWLDRYLPEAVHSRRMFFPVGKMLNEYLPDDIGSGDCVLVDDYAPNLLAWHNKDSAILTVHRDEKENPAAAWDGARISSKSEAHVIVNDILSVINKEESR
jgi:hypothetical protein